MLLCSRCGRGWIKYLEEREYQTAGGRWAEAPIDPEAVATITPAAAAEFVGTAPWRLTGGSGFGSVVRRVYDPGWPARVATS